MALVLRAARFAGFTLLGILLLEVLLHAGAWILGATGRDIKTSWSSDQLRVLCVGDSHTYGLYLDRIDSYPAQLQEVWNQGHLSEPIETLNAGFPGMNSTRLKRDLPGILKSLNPDIVIVLIGANDFWTVPLGDKKPDATIGVLEYGRRNSRVLRLVYAIRGAFAAAYLDEPEVRFEAEAL